ncbi:hypothetical protein [Tabrizicola flagellatus]|uniref:hypothetical protein n=1 Tax=Tabrizicola flagellatus TaxID=2593021 RepID=UPI0011F1FC5F|nr:hypothetical protein [Tabrizicola flagellatus]
MRLILSTTLAAFLVASAATAGCKENFTVEGLPLLSQIQYKSHATYKGLDRTTAAKRIAARLRDEGFKGVKREGGVVSAWQETTGSGRPQTLRFIVTESRGKTTIEGIFTIQQGQIAGNRVVRDNMCKVIAIAAG